MQKITPHIWFENQAEEAAKFYTSIFKNGAITSTSRYSEVGQEVHGMAPGTVMTTAFTIEDFNFIALNGGPAFTPNGSISFFVNYESKDEINELWGKLADSGKVFMELGSYPFGEWYGWVEDRFGLSWQLMLTKSKPAQTIVPSLMFTGDKAGKAEEAIAFYTSVFKNSKPGTLFPYGSGQEPDKEGTLAYADFTLENQLFAAMDSAREHSFTFNEAISLMVHCNDQAEVDYYWEKLSAVPESEQCGWLKDKYGVSWQIAPTVLSELLGRQDAEGSKRAMAAMLKMKKLDIAELEKAYKG